ncbi:MAG: hypothetical protein EHM81_07110 [Chloroflexi bacterium]|nr:MAG: hypothetical protein EHM81_07110 [Chloroflexota bacterium]
MPKAPIELTLYDDADEPIIKLSRVTVPWGILKKAVRLSKTLTQKPEDISDEQIDELTDLVVMIFGEEKVTRDDLEKRADVNDMINVIQSIVSRGRGLVPNAPPAAGK